MKLNLNFMNEFIVGFSKPKKFNIFAWLIMKVEKTSFNHVYINKYSSYLERDMVYEATIHGVGFKLKKLLLDRAVIIEEYKFNIDDDQNKILLQSIYDNLGKDYGYLQLLGNLFIRLGSKVNPFKDGDSKLICLEAVGDLLKCLNIVDDNIDFEDLGLPEIHNIVMEKGEKLDI